MKEELRDSKKYVIGGIVSSESDGIIFPHLIDEFFTETDIKSTINTEEAVIFFKYFIEKYTKTFTDDERKPFDKMVITLNAYFYMKETLANTSDYEYKIKGVSPDDFLKDIVKVVPEITLIMEESSCYYKLPYGTLREHKKIL